MKNTIFKGLVLFMSSSIFVLSFSFFLTSPAFAVNTRGAKTLKRVKSSMIAHPINVHYNPSIRSVWCGYGSKKVLWSGKRKGAYIQIYFKEGILGWVFGDYYGVDSGSGKYVKFKEPFLYRPLPTRESRTLLAREQPNILSPVVGCCRDCLIWIVGKKGCWLHTYNDKWIYAELMEPVIDQFGEAVVKE